MDAKKGDWVQIHTVVLEPGERSERVPEDTQSVPLELRVKGFITRNANKGEQVDIETCTGRKLSGTMVAINPAYGHDFGRPVPELLGIGNELRQILQD
ncbi:2-amino-4-oxopentanoate thiolase subunit OrtA [Chloroflexota bacterium]